MKQLTILFLLCITLLTFSCNMKLGIHKTKERPLSTDSYVTGFRTAAANVLVIEVETPFAEADCIPDMDRELWHVDGFYADNLYRYSVPWEQTFAINSEILMHHYIYFELPFELENEAIYRIETPYGEFEYQFDEMETFCESIKVNQSEYNIDGKVRNAVFGIFLGDGGAVRYDRPKYHVVDIDSGDIVCSGSGDTLEYSEVSGEYTSLLDLSEVTQEGSYFIYVEGMGRSYDFDINDMEHTAYTIFRGLYHQRCGIGLEEPYTIFTRGACHTQVAHTQFDRTTAESGWIVVPENAEMHEIHGGYHDAADYDRREMHTIIPMFMLHYSDIFSDYFSDSQFNIPESGNGIPDFLDEALWGVKLYEYLQLDHGGVMSGTETSQHPGWGKSAATDPLVYGTYSVRGHSTAIAAGLFAHAARLVRPFDSDRANQLLARAVRAWDYLDDHAEMKEDLESQLMYASLQLYLATATGNDSADENNAYHVLFRQYAQAIVVDNSIGWPQEYKPGYIYIDGSNASMTFSPHFMAYLFTEFQTDQVLVQAIKNRVLYSADGSVAEYAAQRYPIGARKAAWASFTGIGWSADVLCMAYAITGDDKYFDSVSRLGDFILGLNALGRSYVTGLGDFQLNSPLHLDSYFTKYGIALHSEPIGNVPGIIVFGANGARSGMSYQMLVSEKIYPDWDDMPSDRRFADGWTLVNQAEFSTWETIVPNVIMYGFLHGKAATEE